MKKLLTLRHAVLALFAFGLLWAAVISCQQQPSPTSNLPGIGFESYLGSSFVFAPAPFPGTSVTGIVMPTPRPVLDQWVSSEDSIEIYKHAWGIWAGLTAPSGISVEGQPLRVYETWLDVEQLAYADSLGIDYDSLIQLPRSRSMFGPVKQLLHTLDREAAVFGLTLQDLKDLGQVETVKYDPVASQAALTNNVFLASTLDSLVQAGDTASIPQFPAPSITLKPTYQVFKLADLDSNRYFRIPVWPGPPGTLDSARAGFGEDLWDRYVWVDIQNQGQGSGAVASGNTPRTPATTYNLDDFISFTLTNQHAQSLNRKNGDRILSLDSGDVAVLVGMHVTSKELRRWTWQTFWWDPNPDAPLKPSDATMASVRPDSLLDAAAAHYAGFTAYSMIDPVQPYTGGSDTGELVICFNPYLEAGFDSSVFTGSQSWVINPQGTKLVTDAGVLTNCMTCHAMASYSNIAGAGTPYSGDAYVDMGDTALFNSVVQLDFLWSIQANVKQD